MSSENWKRPQGELEFLMHLLEQYMIEERSLIMEQDIRVVAIGRREGIPTATLTEMDKTISMTAANAGLRLCLAINYGGRGEIADAAREVARDVCDGRLTADSIDETTIARHLYTRGMADPDLLIRTAGEQRISNFLLWQLSYTEIYFTEKCWPEFAEADLHEAFTWFATRDRRFGGLTG
jgi:undecaprenyl diphosphate synthase